MLNPGQLSSSLIPWAILCVCKRHDPPPRLTDTGGRAQASKQGAGIHTQAAYLENCVLRLIIACPQAPSPLPSYPPGTYTHYDYEVSEWDQTAEQSSPHHINLSTPETENTGQRQQSKSVAEPGLEELKPLVPKRYPFYRDEARTQGLIQIRLQGLTSTSQSRRSTKGQLRRPALTSWVDFRLSWSTLPSPRCMDALLCLVAASRSLVTTWNNSSWTLACSCLYLCRKRDADGVTGRR